MFAPNQQLNNFSCGDFLKNWWKSIPYFNRLICFLCITLYFLSFIFIEIITYGINTPNLTLKKYEFWRLITAPFVHQNILQLIFCLLSFLPTAALSEKQQGSGIFILNLIIEASSIQALFVGIALAVGMVVEGFGQISCGLWSVVMLQITVRSLKDPEEETYFLCFPVKIKQKYYPWIILIFFSFLTAFQIIDLFSGIIIAYIEIKLFNSQFLSLSNSKIQKLEQTLFKCILSNESFVQISDANSGQLPFYQGIKNSENEHEENSNLLPFSGKGVSIGKSPQQQQQKTFNIMRVIYFIRNQIPQQQQQNTVNPNPIKPPIQKHSSAEAQAFAGKGIMLGSDNQTSDLINQAWQPNYGTEEN